MPQIEWEDVHENLITMSVGQLPRRIHNTSRLPVPGGWLYRHREYLNNEIVAMSTTFVPDPSRKQTP
jgi:hypothetical protein